MEEDGGGKTAAGSFSKRSDCSLPSPTQQHAIGAEENIDASNNCSVQDSSAPFDAPRGAEAEVASAAFESTVASPEEFCYALGGGESESNFNVGGPSAPLAQSEDMAAARESVASSEGEKRLRGKLVGDEGVSSSSSSVASGEISNATRDDRGIVTARDDESKDEDREAAGGSMTMNEGLDAAGGGYGDTVVGKSEDNGLWGEHDGEGERIMAFDESVEEGRRRRRRRGKRRQREESWLLKRFESDDGCDDSKNSLFDQILRETELPTAGGGASEVDLMVEDLSDSAAAFSHHQRQQQRSSRKSSMPSNPTGGGGSVTSGTSAKHATGGDSSTAGGHKSARTATTRGAMEDIAAQQGLVELDEEAWKSLVGHKPQDINSSRDSLRRGARSARGDDGHTGTADGATQSLLPARGSGEGSDEEDVDETPLLMYLWEMAVNFLYSRTLRGKQARLTFMEGLEHFDFINDFFFIIRVCITRALANSDTAEGRNNAGMGDVVLICSTCIYLTTLIAFAMRRVIIYHRIEGDALWLFCPFLVFKKIRDLGRTNTEALVMFERLLWTYHLVMRLVEDIPQVICSAIFLSTFGTDFYVYAVIGFNCVLLLITSIRMGVMYPVSGTLSLILSREPPVDSPVMTEAAATTKTFAVFMAICSFLWIASSALCLNFARGLWFYCFCFVCGLSTLLFGFFLTYWFHLVRQTHSSLEEFHRHFEMIGTPRHSFELGSPRETDV